MSWKDEKVNGEDIIDASDWNDHADETLRISGAQASSATSFWGHSGNNDIHFPSSNMTDWFGTLYQPSGTIPNNLISTISSNAVSGQEAKAWLNASGSKYHNAVQFSSNSDLFNSTQYITSSNIKSNYYPSSLGNEVHTWMDNSGSKYSQAYASAQIAVYSETYSSEGDLTSVLDNNYAPSNNLSWASIEDLSDVTEMSPSDGDGLLWSDALSAWSSQTISTSDVAWSGASDYYGHSSNSNIHFTESSIDHTNISNVGSNTHSQIDSSLTDLFSTSSAHDSRLDTLEGYDEFDHELYITSSNSLDIFANSSNYSSHKGNLDIHIDHTKVDISSGDGLTGGGDITTTRLLAVGAGTGITVNADDVEVTDYNGIKASAACGAWASSNLATDSLNNLSEPTAINRDLVRDRDDDSLNLGSPTYPWNVAFVSSLSVGYRMVHEGDTDTGIFFGSDYMKLNAGGTTFIELDENGSDDLVIGKNSGVDVRIQGTATNQNSGCRLICTDGRGKVGWELPDMTYNVNNILISAQQNINVAKFKCPTGKSAHIHQAYACGSGGVSIDDLYIEMLADSSLPLDGGNSVYKTSSATLQQGYPLGESSDGDYIEIRFMYSGSASVSGRVLGTAMMQIGVY